MQAVRFQRDFSSDVTVVRQVLVEALDFIHNTLPLAPKDFEFDMRLILSELVFNAAIHGNNQNPDKLVSLSMEVDGDILKCFVADEGDGYDYEKHISALKDEIATAKESGRGIRLVLSLADNVSFNKRGNIIYFRKKVNSFG